MRKPALARLLVVASAALLSAVAAAPPAFSAAVRAFGSVVEAETYDAQHRTVTFADPAAAGGRAVAFLPGGWLRIDNVDFGVAGQSSGFAIWRSCAIGSSTVEFRLDSPTAPPFLTEHPGAAGCASWYTSSLRLGLSTTVTGVHSFYLHFRSESRPALYCLDSFQLIKQTIPPIP